MVVAQGVRGVLLQLIRPALVYNLFLVSVITSCNGAGGSMNIKCRQPERAALLDLKKAAEDVHLFNVPAARIMSYQQKEMNVWFKWDDEDEDEECCNWPGIICDATSGSITQLRRPMSCGDSFEGVQCKRWRNVYVCGPLPSSLSRLESLEVLDVRGGCFSGALPSHIFSSLANLSHLDLSSNQFSSLPDSLLLPPRLIYLNLSNLWPDNPPNLSQLVTSLPNLEYLDLHQSSLQGFIPDQIGSLRNLKYLDLSSDQYGLQGVIPQQIGSLQNLVYLELGLNYFQNPVPWPSLANLSHLRHLVLGSGDDLYPLDWPEARDDWHCNWKALESLSAYSVRFASNVSLPFCLHDPALITQLKHLHFEKIIDAGSSIAPLLRSFSLANASLSLESLSLPLNSLWEFETEDSKPAWLQALHTPFLEVLDLLGNKLTGIPSWLPHVPLLHSLDMSFNSLSTLPPQLEHLPVLKNLNFRGNQIKGTIPLSLFKPSLLYLDVSDNGLSGMLPFSLGNLSSLSYLDLSQNFLAGEIPHSLGELSSLVHLDLSVNSLRGNIPHSLGELSSLVHLGLSFNSLRGNILLSVGNMSNLVYLDLGSNKHISGGIPPSLGNLSSLETIWLSGNSLTGTLPPCIFQDSLINLDLSENQLLGSLPILQSCFSLTSVSMSNSNLSGTVLGFEYAFQNCPILSFLYLSNNGLSSSLPPIVFHSLCHQLQFLDISKNGIWGEIPREVGNNCSNLYLLNLSDNHLISGALPAAIGNISSLERLYLSNNLLSAHVPASLGNLQGLLLLALHNNKLNGTLPTPLQNCSSLALLILSYNQLSGPIPEWINGQTFPRLRVLVLSSNQLQSSTPVFLVSLVQNFTKLQILCLASNHLTGSIPSNLNRLQAMLIPEPQDNMSGIAITDVSITIKGVPVSLVEYNIRFAKVLDFSDNLLEGGIPQEIGALQGLYSLNLSHNLLNGSIPSSLRKLAGMLESLDLSHNKLTGSIPPELCDFNSLGALNLSHNRLQGAITLSSSCIHLCTFNASCYAYIE